MSGGETEETERTEDMPPERNTGVSILELALKVLHGELTPDEAADIVRKTKDGERSHEAAREKCLIPPDLLVKTRPPRTVQQAISSLPRGSSAVARGRTA